MGYSTLGEAIRKARGHRTREQFAVQLGCSLFTVGNWERGATVPHSWFRRALVDEGVPREAFGEKRASA